MTRETLDKLRAMGMNLGPQYDMLADLNTQSRKNDADNARITDIQVKTATQKKDNNKYFIVRVALSTDFYVGKVELEIDGKTFQAFQKSNVFELFAFYANVYVDLSIPRIEENPSSAKCCLFYWASHSSIANRRSKFFKLIIT